jgi:nicotinate phosphoribosyltransferase
LDSGDVIALSRQVRSILDEAGLHQTAIFLSGDLDEWRIAGIVQSGAPVDGFGVGAALSTASDAPSLGAIYKLVEIEREGVAVPVMKRSPGKHTYPGRKQAWRIFDGDTAVEDVIELAGEDRELPAGRPLLACVMRDGKRRTPRRPVREVRDATRAAIAALPAAVRRLEDPVHYNIRPGNALQSALASASVLEW